MLSVTHLIQDNSNPKEFLARDSKYLLTASLELSPNQCLCLQGSDQKSGLDGDYGAEDK